MIDFISFEQSVTDHIADLLECSNSDAQGVAEANENFITASYFDGLTALETASLVSKL